MECLAAHFDNAPFLDTLTDLSGNLGSGFCVRVDFRSPNAVIDGSLPAQRPPQAATVAAPLPFTALHSRIRPDMKSALRHVPALSKISDADVGGNAGTTYLIIWPGAPRAPGPDGQQRRRLPPISGVTRHEAARWPKLGCVPISGHIPFFGTPSLGCMSGRNRRIRRHWDAAEFPAYPVVRQTLASP